MTADVKTNPDTRKKRILVVDDNVGITNLWRVMLEKTGGYIIREENQSRRALATTRDFRPHLLLLDIDMPDLDGTDIARLVQSDHELGHPAIVFLSSLVRPGETSAGTRVDGHPCLPKPTCVVELVKTIENSLGAVT